MRLNLQSENLKSVEALNMLLNGYPSHSFVIDFTEAKALFNSVQPLDDTLVSIEECLGSLAIIPLDETVICFLEAQRDEDENSLGEDSLSDAEGGRMPANDARGDDEAPKILRQDIQG